MKKIMLIDDDPNFCLLLETLLKFEGYQTICPCNLVNEIIFDSLNKEKPDIILMDVNLHSINGLDIVQYIRKDIKYDDVKIIMTSGMALNDDCIKSGADAFLMKPFMPEELFLALRSVCGEKT
jgi:DNA-binding response OmpR family regulator